MSPKPSLLVLGLLFLVACTSTKPTKPLTTENKADSGQGVLHSPGLVPEEEMLFSEVTEFINLGLESITDSLWFQAGEDFDSALIKLAGLEATDSLSPSVLTKIKVYRDSVQNLLIGTVAKTSQMSQPVPLTELFDQEMEGVSDSSVHAIDSITHYINPKAYDLPLTSPLDPRVLQAISVFMGPGKGYFAKWLNRKSRYEKIIRTKLAERDMPKDLMYLAMVESGFNPKAWSKASASGMWQFISGTGRRYGLQDDWWYDARRDPIMATDAALDYLGDLNDEFEDWHLAMAAYNCGEGRIRRYRSQDSSLTYWKMPLPQETRFYVPKILAAMIIGHNPERYGFVVDKPELPLEFDTASVHDCLSIRAIAQAAGVSEDTIISLNPALRRWCTPPDQREYQVNIPTGTRDVFLQNYALLDKSQLVTWHHHIVGRGDNINSIASRYRVSVAAIKATNKIKGNKLHKGQSLLIPLAPVDAVKYAEKDEPGRSERSGGRRGNSFQRGTYKVRSGDNLFDIARRFNTTVSQLKLANHLRSGTGIRPGQKLRLGTKPALTREDDMEDHHEPEARNALKKVDETVETSLRTGTKPGLSNKFQVYRVTANENIFSIAMKLGISENNLRKWNGIQGNRILVGQKLKYLGTRRTDQRANDQDEPGSDGEEEAVVAGSSKDSPSGKSTSLAASMAIEATGNSQNKVTEKQYYLIKGGDSLWDIAVKYRSTVQRLKELNGRLPAVLKPGTRIRVK